MASAGGAGAGPAEIAAIFASLDVMHADRGWHWWPDADPFEVIVGCILVQNTAWVNVERALDRLGAAGALTPASMAALAAEALEVLVRPSGQFRQKARKLAAFLALVEAWGSLDALLAVEGRELRALLLGTWGIGPETADSIVVYAARQPAFVVDAYTARLFSRLGMGPGETAGYDAWQRFMVERVPEDREVWARYHALVVMHCKHLCRKLRPKCGECSLHERCAFAQAKPT